MRVTKTKIIATIGPSTNEYSLLKDLHAAGMNVARLNMSHASQTDALKIIELINKVNKNQSKLFGPIGVLLDTQGPEIRTGINQSDIDLKTGDIVNLTIRDDIDVETSSIKINYKGLIRSVDRGSKISIDNGLLNFQVLAKDNESLKCKVLDGGTLGSKRHVNLPGVRVDLPSITKKDRKDIKRISQNFPITEFYKTDEILTSLGIGEALITAINEKGIPTPLVATLLRSPQSRMGILNQDEINSLLKKSEISDKYNQEIDRESAHEILNKKIRKTKEQESSIPGDLNKTTGTKRAPDSDNSSLLAELSKNTMVRQMGRTVGRELVRGLFGVLGFKRR